MCECKSASDKDAGEDNDGDNKDTGKEDDCKEAQAEPGGLPSGEGTKAAQPDPDHAVASSTTGGRGLAGMALRERGRGGQTGVENAAVNQRVWAQVFARRCQRREEKLHVRRSVCPLGGILGLCSRRPGVASRECEPAPHASHVQGPWLALIETHKIPMRLHEFQ